MNLPIKVFEIKGFGQERIKLEISEVFGFPDETSFRGGYDIRCNLEINAGIYTCRTEQYFSTTSAIYNFYVALQNCYDKLNGKAIYSVYCPENDLIFEAAFKQGQVKIEGTYRHDPSVKDVLTFEFNSDQSYFKEVLSDLKKVYLTFGGNKGVNK